MPSIRELPTLPCDVAIHGKAGFDETAGPACFALGVVAGVFINRQIN
ncbi:hypothetical protein [Stenotrophomonas sp.]|nr:hypothetical protein [Stenotrophomonas sp.]